MGDFTLDTKSMDSAAKSCQTLADKVQSVKDLLKSTKASIAFNWEGRGSAEFMTSFRMLQQQLSDVTETLFEYSEAIITAEEAYIQTDTETAKGLDGVQTTPDNYQIEDEEMDVFGS